MCTSSSICITTRKGGNNSIQKIPAQENCLIKILKAQENFSWTTCIKPSKKLMNLILAHSKKNVFNKIDNF